MPDLIGFETSYRQFLSQTQAAIAIGKCRWICDFIGISNRKFLSQTHEAIGKESENSDSAVGKKNYG